MGLEASIIENTSADLFYKLLNQNINYFIYNNVDPYHIFDIL